MLKFDKIYLNTRKKMHTFGKGQKSINGKSKVFGMFSGARRVIRPITKPKVRSHLRHITENI